MNRHSPVVTKEQLNPYLGFPNATCPSYQAQDVHNLEGDWVMELAAGSETRPIKGAQPEEQWHQIMVII